MKWLKWGAIAFVLLAIGSALGSSSGDDKKATNDLAAKVAETDTATADSEVADGEVEETSTPEPEPEPVPDPDGTYELSCDYDLGDFDESGIDEAGYKFIAGGTLKNTGNVGIVADVTYKWRLLGQGWLKETKTYKVPYDRKRDVDILIPVGSEEIDAHQSADGDCRTSVKIVDSFGKVHE